MLGNTKMQILNCSDIEYKQHASAINSISGHYHIAEPIIREIYEEQLWKLLQHARIKIYLSILTVRYVKDIILRS